MGSKIKNLVVIGYDIADDDRRNALVDEIDAVGKEYRCMVFHPLRSQFVLVTDELIDLDLLKNKFSTCLDGRVDDLLLLLFAGGRRYMRTFGTSISRKLRAIQ